MRVIVIGSGIGGVTFSRELKKRRPATKITIITKDKDFYYYRPTLTQGFCTNDIDIIKAIDFETLRNEGIEIIESVEAEKITVANNSVTFTKNDQSETITYDKLVMACGSEAMIPPPYLKYSDNFHTFHSLTDLNRLKKLRESIITQKDNIHWAIVGGGAIGCELASEIAYCGDRVTVVHIGDRLIERLISEERSEELAALFSDQGIEVKLNQNLKSILDEDGHKLLIDENENEIGNYDIVIVATGFRPNTSLAKEAGIECNRGVSVNRHLETSEKDIYSIGDMAEIEGELYLFTYPIWKQAQTLALNLTGSHEEWTVPDFPMTFKIHGFKQ